MIDPNRMLWLQVIYLAFADATSDGMSNTNGSAAQRGSHEQVSADRWIRDCGRDFRTVCALAGIDAEFLSGAYRAGRVDARLLRSIDRPPVSEQTRIKNRAYQASLYVARRARRAGGA